MDVIAFEAAKLILLQSSDGTFWLQTRISDGTVIMEKRMIDLKNPVLKKVAEMLLERAGK